MKRKGPTATPSVVAFVVVLVLGALGSVGPAAGQSQSQSRFEVPGGDPTAREVLAGVPGHFPPHYVLDGEAAPSGFAIDVLDAVAKDAGIAVRYVVLDTWPKVIQALERGEIDIVPNVGITPARERYFRFSAPVETFAIGLFKRATQNEEIRGVDDLAGHRVSVVRRNIGERLLKGREGVHLVVHDSRSEALFALLAGQSDAFVYPLDVTLKMAADAGIGEHIETVGPPLKEVKRAIGVRRGWPELADRISASTARFVGTDAYRTVYSKWYGAAKVGTSRADGVSTGVKWAVGALLLGLVLSMIAMLIWRLREAARMRSVTAEGKADHARAIELQAIIDSAPDAMVIVDGGGTIERVNQQTELMFGYPRSELLGQAVEMLLPESAREAHVGSREGFFLTPRNRMMGAGLKLTARKADGGTFPIDVNLSPVRLEGRTLVSAAVRDVTVQRALEQELRDARDQAEVAATGKARFLAAASHNLRQPLQALSMYLAVLSRLLENDRQAEIAGKMTEALEAMGSLLNALLDISKLDAGAVEPSVSKFRLDELFRSAVAQVAPVAEEKGLALDVGAARFTVLSDRDLLQRVVDNFLGNAIRYTEAGEVRLACRQVGDRLAIEVWDTGIGIPKAELDTIFDEYVQLHNPARDRAKGLGLGLSVVRRIADLLGLELSVASEPGKGSTFSVLIPEGGFAPASKEFPRASTSASSDTLSVLYVEDDPVVMDATRLLLEAEGFDISVALEGESALERVGRGERPDVILSDYRLPGRATGTDLVRQIRDIAGEDIPAIIMTGDTSRKQIEDSDLAHCEILHKPAGSEQLIARIKTVARL